MIDLPMLIAVFLAGAVLGILYFSGLLITVRFGVAHRFCAPLFVASFLIRIAILMAGLVVILTWNSYAVILLLAGMLTVRTVYLLSAQQGDSHQQDSGGAKCI